VADNGIGIEQEKLDEIFDRFNQADDSITRNYGGTGLGLSIVRDLLLIQNGNISVVSTPGIGIEFSFYIPYLIADIESEEVAVRYKMTERESAGQSVHILVVDDNRMNQDLMAHILEYWGFTFAIISNGREAIASISQGHFDLVLMDIQMPEMDGYSATIHIRTILKSNIPIIAMTAHAMAGEREKCTNLGMNDYISKPVNEHELLELIHKFTVSYRQHEDRLLIYHYLNLDYLKDMGKGDCL